MEKQNKEIWDVAVIGSGPAGLSAAIRARWVKTHGGVCCKTVMVEGSGKIGGLANMGGTKLTGPAFNFNAQTFLAPLLEDVKKYNIPILRESITSITKTCGMFQLKTLTGQNISARSVILATGMRELSNEADFFLKGIVIPYNGYDYTQTLLERETAKCDKDCVVVLGNAKTANLAPVLEPAFSSFRQKYFVSTAHFTPTNCPLSGFTPIQASRVDFEGNQKLEAVKITMHGVKPRIIKTKLVFADYIAFETRPEINIEIPGLSKTPEGFVRTDKTCATNIPGLFAAGDVTGMYAMVLKAASEGAISAFSAYRYVFDLKFKSLPSLYAYAANDIPIEPDAKDYPEFFPHHTLIALADKPQWQSTWQNVAKTRVPEHMNLRMDELEKVLGKKPRQVVIELLESKDFTLTV